MAWKHFEDALLLEGVKKYGTLKWKQIAASMLSHQRSHVACKLRFLELMESKHWTIAEDEKLKGLVQNLGSQYMWGTISLAMNRPSNSCFARHLFLSNERMAAIPLPNFENQNVALIPRSKIRKHLVTNPVAASHQPKFASQNRKRKHVEEIKIPLGFIPKAKKKPIYERGMKLKLDLQN